jgi:CubicO group peptidase (beta-lactamase class C family)
MVAGILVEQLSGHSLHEVYRELVCDPARMDSTWLEGHEPARTPQVAHHYSDELDWTISPTIDWAGPGVMACLRNLVIGLPGQAGPVHLAAELRRQVRDLRRRLATLGISLG